MSSSPLDRRDVRAFLLGVDERSSEGPASLFFELEDAARLRFGRAEEEGSRSSSRAEVEVEGGGARESVGGVRLL